MPAVFIGGAMNFNPPSPQRVCEDLDPVYTKVLAGDRLTFAEAVTLFKYADLNVLGSLANGINRKKNAGRVYYNVNRHINPGNICALQCTFCAFSRKESEEGSFCLSLPEIRERAQSAAKQGATEIHLTAGLHPEWEFSHYKNIIKTLKEAAPAAAIKAFTAVEIAWLASHNSCSVEEVLRELMACGLESLTGGGAEIFNPEVRTRIAPKKISAQEWLAVHRSAHKMGLKTTCTMLYGHIESIEDRVEHLFLLRELQEQTGGFLAFVPLKFQAWFDPKTKNYALGVKKSVSSYVDLRVIAMARIILDNFSNIKAYWVMLGKEVAQMALAFGANDIDGTVEEENIARMAQVNKQDTLSRTELESLIYSAGYSPVERTTYYKEVEKGKP